VAEPVAGRLDRVAPGVRRLTAPNPGVMTGPGTNSYLVGAEEVAVIDPGPADEGHLDALARAGNGRIRWILTTHTHPDHAPGAAGLAERTGAEVLGFARRDGFEPDGLLGEGSMIEADAFRLRAVHTPGHASNHLCFLLEQAMLLFSGDHVMDGSTVVVSPPDGDMADYLRSLRRLLDLRPPLAAIAPGHGAIIDDPASRLSGYIEHRLERERLVLAALADAGSATVDELLPVVYADVDEDRHPIARRSLFAHLRKLAGEGAVAGNDVDDADTTWHAPRRV
jgi:glyoxylase-like metal-dependent hydrolase (beta-lactamase superfamily II)